MNDNTKAIYRQCQEDISGPGRFEGCAIYVPYFWGQIMSGFTSPDYDLMEQDRRDMCNTLGIDPDSDEGLEVETPILDTFQVIDEDRAIFPELAMIKTVTLWCDDQGFVHCIEHPCFAPPREFPDVGDPVTVWDDNGIIRRSRNLRGILDYARTEGVESVYIARLPDDSALVAILFGWFGTASSIVHFGSYDVARAWVRARRSWSLTEES